MQSDIEATTVVDAGRELAELIEEAQRQGTDLLAGTVGARRVPTVHGTRYEIIVTADDGSALKITVEAA